MAGSSTVKIEILGESKPAQAAFAAVERTAGKMGSTLGKLTGSVGKVGTAFGGMAKVAGGFVLGNAILNAPSALMGMAQAAAEDAASMGRLQQAVTNAEGSFEGHAAAIEGAIKAGQNLAFSDDDVRSGLALMTAQLGDADEAMARLPLAMDLARGAGIDLEQASKLLGKTSEENTTALSRLGIVLGDTATEQDVLNAVQAKFGGQAGEFAESDAGKFAKLRDRIGEAQEQIGAKLLPVMVSLADFIANRVMPVVENLIERFGGPISHVISLARDAVLTFVQALSGDWQDAEGIHPLHRAFGLIGTVIREQVIPFVMQMADFFTNRVIPVVQEVIGFVGQLVAAFRENGLSGALGLLMEKLGPLGEQLATWAGGILVLLVEKIGQWAGAFLDWIGPMIPPFLEKLGELLASFTAWFVDVGLPAILEKLGEWGQALIDWIGPRIPPMLEALGELLSQLGTWFVETGLPAIVEKLEEWGIAFLNWIGPKIGPMLTELGNLLAALGAWVIDTGLPELIAKLEEWGTAFIEWVGPKIPPLLAELGSLLAELGGWMLDTALPEIVAKLTEWGLAFLEWIAKDVLPELPGKLLAILTAVGDFLLTTALPEIITKLGEWGLAFLEWIAKDVLPFLGEKLGAILTDVGSWVINEGVPGLISAGKDMGSAVIDGIVAGIEGAWHWLTGKLQSIINAVNGVIGKVNGALGSINSALEFSVNIPGVDMPGPIPDIPSTSFSFDAPDIPAIPLIPGVGSGNEMSYSGSNGASMNAMGGGGASNPALAALSGGATQPMNVPNPLNSLPHSAPVWAPDNGGVVRMTILVPMQDAAAFVNEGATHVVRLRPF